MELPKLRNGNIYLFKPKKPEMNTGKVHLKGNALKRFF
jgi:hypothetical protein